MSLETVARIIAVILTPVIMVTACAILINGLLGHYSEVNLRLRALAGERLALAYGLSETGRNAAFRTERLPEIDVQLPELLSRHKLIRDSLARIYLATLLFIADMFVISVAAVSGNGAVATASLALFLASTAVLFWGLLLALIEVGESHRTVENEVRRVARLSERPGEAPPAP